MADEKRENKSFPFVEIKSASSDRTKTGICAVFGNVDEGWDRIHFGAFRKTLNEGRERVVHLWNHNANLPPIAKIIEIRELGKSDLPQEVVDFAPDSTGGLLVKRDYLKHPTAEAVFECLQESIIREMSIGFETVKADYSMEDQKEIRELRELKLFDTSDVPWGMNPATLASKSALYDGLDAESYFQQLPLALVELKRIMKEGRRNAAADMDRIKTLHQFIVDLGFDQCMDKPADQSEESGKSAEAVIDDTSLRQMSLELMALDLNELIS